MSTPIHKMTDDELSDAWEDANNRYSHAKTEAEENAIAVLINRIENEQDSREMGRIEEWWADPS